MSFKNVFWGVLLLTIGLLYALRNFGVIWFSWGAVVDLWPLLLLLWGVSLLPVKPVIKLAGSLGVLVLAVVLVLVRPGGDGFSFQFGHQEWSYDHNYDSDEASETYRDQSFSLPMANAASVVKLKLNAAAGRFELSDTTHQLIDFRSNGNIGPYTMTPNDGTPVNSVKIDLDDVSVNSGRVKNEVFLKLNPVVIWEIDVEAGASKVEMDMQAFKIRRLELDGGASSVDLVLGSLVDTVDVDLEVGVSELTLSVPKESACEVRTDAVLSGRKLDGFDKISTGLYRTSNFDSSPKKIFIKAEAAISSIKVERY